MRIYTLLFAQPNLLRLTVINVSFSASRIFPTRTPLPTICMHLEIPLQGMQQQLKLFVCRLLLLLLLLLFSLWQQLLLLLLSKNSLVCPAATVAAVAAAVAYPTNANPQRQPVPNFVRPCVHPSRLLEMPSEAANWLGNCNWDWDWDWAAGRSTGCCFISLYTHILVQQVSNASILVLLHFLECSSWLAIFEFSASSWAVSDLISLRSQ